MKTVKVPVALVVFVALLIIALVVYLYNQNSRLAGDIISNERMKQENERLNLLANLQTSQQLEKLELREPIGFKLA